MLCCEVYTAVKTKKALKYGLWSNVCKYPWVWLFVEWRLEGRRWKAGPWLHERVFRCSPDNVSGNLGHGQSDDVHVQLNHFIILILTVRLRAGKVTRKAFTSCSFGMRRLREYKNNSSGCRHVHRVYRDTYHLAVTGVNLIHRFQDISN